MTPQEIAREAAETEHRATLLTIDGKGKEAKEVALNALILTAAAKMVRDSGAVEALAHSPTYAAVRDGMAYCRYDDLLEWCKARDAALAKLRAINTVNPTL